MDTTVELPQRKQPRLKQYDYSSSGALHNVVPSPVGEGAERSEADEVLALYCTIVPSGVSFRDTSSVILRMTPSPTGEGIKCGARGALTMTKHSAYKFKQDVREKTVVAVLHFFAALVAATLDVVSIAMMIRMIFSLFFAGDDNRFMMFLACVTEPFIAPIRFLLAKFNILQNSPIDWSFTISYFIIVMIRTALPVIL